MFERRKRWFEALVDTELDDLLGHVRSVYPLADAERVTSEAMARARADGPPHPSITARAWLRRHARAVVHAHDGGPMERRRQMDAVQFQIRDAVGNAHLSSDGDVTALLEVLDAMTVDDREILRMTCIEDLSVTELAIILGLAEDAARARLAEAETRFRDGFDMVGHWAGGGGVE